MAILTLDLGTTNTKAAVWEPDGLVAVGRTGLVTTHPEVGWAEQDAGLWWPAVVSACSAARQSEPSAFSAVDVIGLSGARQTFVPTTAEGEPIGPALLWSDTRGNPRVPGGTGARGAGVGAKLAWLERHEPARLAAARWALGPRDLIAWRLTGQFATDWTMASAAGPLARLPPPVASTTVIGQLRPDAATSLGLRAGIPVVIGAGDRQCEVVGSGASPARPMVSWGTTANVSAPVDAEPSPEPAGLLVTRSATGGWLLEGGVSAAGSFLGWLGGLIGLDAAALSTRAAASPPGARGVIATPWLGGARAPWWNDQAGAAFVGLSPAHDAGDLARAAVEAVAWEIDRCLREIGAASGVAATGLAVSGGGKLWTDVLTGITGLPGWQRRSEETASAGAALLAAAGVGRVWDLDRLNPIVSSTTPDPPLAAEYRTLRPSAARAAKAVMGLAEGTATFRRS